MGNEVLIPLGSEVLGECIEYESRWLASLSDDAAQQTEQREQKEQREETVKRIERLYGEWAKRCSQDTEVWVKYWWFERSNGQFEKAQKVYNRAVHLLSDIGAFEEKVSLLESRRPLCCVCSKTRQILYSFPFAKSSKLVTLFTSCVVAVSCSCALSSCNP